MSLGLIGRKTGMTRIFTEGGAAIPVTVIQVLPNKVTQIKTRLTDGYSAVQVTFGQRNFKHVTNPLRGHYAKANVEPGVGLWEFRTKDAQIADFTIGQAISVELFQDAGFVDVTGITKGKGFAGVVKRHHFRTQDATHGNSLSHRAPGSIGQNQSPGKVFKGKKMCGHLGNVQRTVKNLKIIKVDVEKNLILVRGAVPGFNSQIVVLHPTQDASN